MAWEIVMGLEVHVELNTKTKIFCSCTTAFGGEPNTHCCPVCTGQPGSLPVLNKQVLEYAVKTLPRAAKLALLNVPEQVGQVFPALAQYDYTPVRGETLAHLLEEGSNG